MKIIDTNMILRFLLRDNEQMADTAAEIIDNESVIVTNEIIAEAVYVLSGVYKIGRREISNALLEFIFIDNVKAKEHMVLSKALNIYTENNLDFVDCLLCAYELIYGYEVCTFDTKLNRTIQKLNEK